MEWTQHIFIIKQNSQISRTNNFLIEKLGFESPSSCESDLDDSEYSPQQAGGHLVLNRKESARTFTTQPCDSSPQQAAGYSR